MPPPVDGVPQAPTPGPDLPTLTTVRCKGTWYPYPADEAQTEINRYCREEMPALFARRLEAAERPWFGEDFKSGFLWGAGATAAATLAVVLVVSL